MFSWTLITLATLAINLAAAAPAPWDNDKAATYSGSGGQSGGGSVTNTDDNSLLGQIIGPLANVGSDNAGDGGDTDSGSAFVSDEGLHGHGKYPQTKSLAAYSGSGGSAGGGSSTEKSALINLNSGDAGSGGSAKSGLSDVGVVPGAPLGL